MAAVKTLTVMILSRRDSPMDDGELLEKVDVREEQGDLAEKRPDPARETSNVYPFVWRGERQPYEGYKTKAKTPRLMIWYACKFFECLYYRESSVTKIMGKNA